MYFFHLFHILTEQQYHQFLSRLGLGCGWSHFTGRAGRLAAQGQVVGSNKLGQTSCPFRNFSASKLYKYDNETSVKFIQN